MGTWLGTCRGVLGTLMGACLGTWELVWEPFWNIGNMDGNVNENMGMRMGTWEHLSGHIGEQVHAGRNLLLIPCLGTWERLGLFPAQGESWIWKQCLHGVKIISLPNSITCIMYPLVTTLIIFIITCLCTTSHNPYHGDICMTFFWKALRYGCVYTTHEGMSMVAMCT